MNQSLTILDPTSEQTPVERARQPRLAGLNGRTVGLLDISKPRGDLFLAQVQTELEARGATVRRYKKPTFAKIAPTPLQQQIAVECDAVIEALAD